jgi:hypothetical protein
VTVTWPGRVPGDQAGVQAGDLLGAQVLEPCPQQAPDLVERVVPVSAVPHGVLLDAAADFVDHAGA